MGVDPLSIIALVLVAAGAVVAAVYASKAQDAIASLPDAEQQTISEMEVTELSEGKVVPLLYGYNCVAGNIISWYADKQNSGKGDYYKICLWLVLGMGKLVPVAKYTGELYKYKLFGWDWWDIIEKLSHVGIYDEVQHWILDDERPIENHLDNYGQSPQIEFSDMHPLHYYQSGGDGENYKLPLTSPTGHDILNIPPIRDVYTLFATKLKGIAHVFMYNIDLDVGRINIPNYKFKVKKILDTGLPYDNIKVNEEGYWYAAYIGNNPAGIIYDLLTNKQYGLGLDSSAINKSNFIIAANYFYEKKMALNFAINTQTSVRDIINKIQEWTDCYLIKNIDDKYEIAILQESDINNPKATIYDKDIIELTIRRKSWDETYNSFTANYKPTYHVDSVGYVLYDNNETRTMTAKNEANISFTGGKREKVVDLTGFSYPPAVAYRLHQIMKKESYPFANGYLKTNLSFIYLQVGDVIIIDSDEYNASMSYSIINKNVNKIDENIVEFSLLQMREIYADDSFTIDDYITGSRNRNSPEITTPPCLENLTFPAFSAVSNPLSYKFQDDSKSIVHWGTGQLMTGKLTYNVDYTVDEHDKIHLNETLYADEIMHNSNGLMNIDVYELGCPSVES